MAIVHKKKRIAIVAASCPPRPSGGVGIAHYNLFLFLKEHGYETTFFTYRDTQTPSPADKTIIRFTPPAFVNSFLNLFLKFFWRFADGQAPCIQMRYNIHSILGGLVVRYRLKKYRPDIIILPDRGAVGLWIGKPAASRVIAIQHHNPDRFRSSLLFGFTPSAKDIDFALRMERAAMRFTDHVICPSHYMASCYRRTFGSDKPLEVIPNLVAASLLDVNAPPLPELLGFPAECPAVYIPEPSAPNKGERYVFELLRRIHAEVPNAVFYLSGSISSVHQEELGYLSFRDRIYTPGRLPYAEHLKIVAGCSVCVNPSLTENYSMALCEATLLGVPSVIFDAGGNKDMVTDQETGYIVPLLDVDALVMGAILLLKNSSLRESFATKGKERLQRNIENAREMIISLIDNEQTR